MSDSKTNALELSVSELSFALKKTVEEKYGYVRVRGEVGRVSRPASGHIYLDLKDEKAVLNGVIWRGVSSRLKYQPEEGLEVIASGKLTTFPGSSKYQIVIDNIEPAGAGALMALLEERKKKLGAEGLFEEGRKQLLPYMPKIIGVVTSPSGSVIRDILHRLKDRFSLHVLVWPVRVQGEGCGAEVAAAIAGFNQFEHGGDIPRPDLIIVARGGGSIEDLWGFNEEAVVRAAAQSDIPLISAVGHETDWTLLDLVADQRAPTPTAAAEMAVPVRRDLEVLLVGLSARLGTAIERMLDILRDRLRSTGRALSTPQTLLDIPRQKFDNVAMRLGQGLAMAAGKKRTAYEKIAGRLSWHGLQRTITSETERVNGLSQRGRRAIQQQFLQHRARVEQASRLLGSLSYKNVLERGYAVISDKNGKPVTSAAGVSANSLISVQMRDGAFAAQTIGDKSIKAKPASRKSPTDQGDLF